MSWLGDVSVSPIIHNQTSLDNLMATLCISACHMKCTTGPLFCPNNPGKPHMTVLQGLTLEHMVVIIPWLIIVIRQAKNFDHGNLCT